MNILEVSGFKSKQVASRYGDAHNSEHTEFLGVSNTPNGFVVYFNIVKMSS